MQVTDYPIAKDISVVANAFTTGQGIGSALTAGVNIGISALGAFLDPLAWVVGQIMEPIYNWILDNAGFVKETLNLLLGNPEEVSRTGQCSTAQADRIAQRMYEFDAKAMEANPNWKGPGAGAAGAILQAYSRVQVFLVEILKMAGMGIEAVASIVDLVKQFIIGLAKDALNQLISKAVMSALASFVTFGAAYAAWTAWAAGKVAALAAKVSGFLGKLAQKAAGKAKDGSMLQTKLNEAAEALFRMQAGFLQKVAAADQAHAAADQARQRASQAGDYDLAGSGAHSEADHYNQQAQQARQDATDLTNQSNQTRPNPGPGTTTTVGADAVNNAQQGEDERAGRLPK